MTYVDGGLHARLNPGAFERNAHLAHLLFAYLGQRHPPRELLRVGELVFDGLRPRHGHDDGDVGEAVLHGEVDAVLLDVGDDDGLGSRCLTRGRAQQTHGAGAEHQHRGAGLQLSSVARVHGYG